MVEFILGGWKYMINPAPPPVRLSLSFHAQGLLLKLCKLLQIRQYHLVGSTSPCGIQHQLPQIDAPNPMHPKHLWFLHWARPSFFIRNQVPLSNTARSLGVPAPVMQCRSHFQGSPITETTSQRTSGDMPAASRSSASVEVAVGR
jgi:hypothetical protein